MRQAEEARAQAERQEAAPPLVVGDIVAALCPGYGEARFHGRVRKLLPSGGVQVLWDEEPIETEERRKKYGPFEHANTHLVGGETGQMSVPLRLFCDVLDFSMFVIALLGRVSEAAS